MARPSAGLRNEVAQTIGYVVPHPLAGSGYQSIIYFLEKGDDGALRCSEATKSPAELAQEYGLVMCSANTAVNAANAAGIAATPNEYTNFRLEWLVGNEMVSYGVRCTEEQANELQIGLLRAAAASSVAGRRATERTALRA